MLINLLIRLVILEYVLISICSAHFIVSLNMVFTEWLRWQYCFPSIFMFIDDIFFIKIMRVSC